MTVTFLGVVSQVIPAGSNEIYVVKKGEPGDPSAGDTP